MPMSHQQKLLCTLSAKDRGATKNPADLELILMHHFSRILSLDISSVLSKALSFTSCISKITQNMVDQKC